MRYSARRYLRAIGRACRAVRRAGRGSALAVDLRRARAARRRAERAAAPPAPRPQAGGVRPGRFPAGTASRSTASATGFAEHEWTPFAFQEEVWRAYLAGESVLIHAATGTGKTYAAWLGPMLEWLRDYPARAAGASPQPPLRVLWITPLRALAGDTEEALRAPVRGSRASPGPSSPAPATPRPGCARASAQRLPDRARHHPGEPLAPAHPRRRADALRPSRARGGGRVARADGLASAACRPSSPSRGCGAFGRGSAPSGSPPRSATSTRRATRCSAWTPAGAAAGPDRAGARAQGAGGRRPHSRRRWSASPGRGRSGCASCPRWSARSRRARARSSSPTPAPPRRSGTRRCSPSGPDWAGIMALHHGSMDRAHPRVGGGRAARAASCAASSAPRRSTSAWTSPRWIGCSRSGARRASAAWCSARAGAATGRARSAGSPACPTNALELVDVAAARDGARGAARSRRAGRSSGRSTCSPSTRSPWRSAAASGADELLARGAHHLGLPRAPGRRVALGARLHHPRRPGAPELPGVQQGGGARTASTASTSRMVAMRHRLSIGTIVSESAMKVQFLRGRTLGTVEENFVARLRPGDVFTFAGRTLEFVRVRDMVACVRKTTKKSSSVPHWSGARMPHLAPARRRGSASSSTRRGGAIYEGPEMEAVRPILEVQAPWSQLPAPDELLIERVETARGPSPLLLSGRGAAGARGAGGALRLPDRRSSGRSASPSPPTTTASSCSRPSGRRSTRRSRPGCSRPAHLLHDIPGEPQRRRAGAAAVPGDRPGGGAHLPGVSGREQVGEAAAGIERAALRRVRPLRSRTTCCCSRRTGRCWSASWSRAGWPARSSGWRRAR